MKIAIVADFDTVKCFKLAGLEHAYAVKNVAEAEERVRALLETPDFALIIVTDQIANQIHTLISAVTEEKEFPLIISVPNVSESSPLALDQINELIKRKTGIELKL